MLKYRTLLRVQRLPNFYNRKMCILFIHNASKDPSSDYRLIIATNRDELYDRPAIPLGPWEDDNTVIGGKDLEGGGTWLAVCPMRRKMGVLLNLPTKQDPNAKTRGKIVADYVKSNTSAEPYIKSIMNYVMECNHFNFVAVDLGKDPKIQTYSNFSNQITTWETQDFGISNNIPDKPLKKVEAGKLKMNDICNKYKKASDKTQLINEIINLLKSSEKYLPDPVLEAARAPGQAEPFSSIYVDIPAKRYGTRTHTVILITKTGHMDIIESTMKAPVDLENPEWHTTQMNCDIPL